MQGAPLCHHGMMRRQWNVKVHVTFIKYISAFWSQTSFLSSLLLSAWQENKQYTVLLTIHIYLIVLICRLTFLKNCGFNKWPLCCHSKVIIIITTFLFCVLKVLQRQVVQTQVLQRSRVKAVFLLLQIIHQPFTAGYWFGMHSFYLTTMWQYHQSSLI